MSESNNPFIRGYRNLRIIRTLLITYEADKPPVCRMLHASQADLPDLATPEAFLFIAFRIPYSPAIGVKLISTPWTDENLLQAEGITATQLRQEHRTKGMPDDLAQILELAGKADVRILILDADARVLPGLPLNEP